ncbi:RNA polymerase sigma factor CnrH [Cognatishimia activa]|uniref:RNA polymerase sigma factor CnrH n=1 Tax=Cognatishimia activa TaxID=1715691 RepID=A0A0P1IUC6_9RHOB|nr:RNA polymerase sigma factor [Cognatishimia activa]CUI30547.1 RNA polymerase sigma factor CnrH [Cognatishimia activa]CUK24861.1 RNA polymerase sigma factor CnrH [Cognatishimia activa]
MLFPLFQYGFLHVSFDHQLKEALPHLWRYGFSLTRDRVQADDLVQDSVERALRKRKLWDQSQPLKPWVMKILLNVFRDRFRARNRLAEVPFEPEYSGSVEDRSVEDRSELNAVVARMQTLPETQLQALQLVAFGGLTYAECAEVLGVPTGTILSRVARARAKLNEDAAKAAPTLRSVT